MDLMVTSNDAVVNDSILIMPGDKLLVLMDDARFFRISSTGSLTSYVTVSRV